MFRFRWSALVSSSLLEELRALAGIGAGEPLDALVPALESIFASTGGLPVVPAVPSDAERDAFARRLLGEAVCHALGHARASANAGYRVARTGIDELAAVAKASPRVGINWAPPGRIAEATGVALSLAEKIVAERRANGAFHSLEELDRRLKGVDIRNRRHFASAVSFEEPSSLAEERAAPTGDLQKDLGSLLELQAGGTPLGRMSAALEGVAASVARAPHPATLANRRRDWPAPSRPEPASECKWVGALFRSEYHDALQTLFASAERSIDVCMFHISLPGPNHPTRKLVDALAAAKTRGLAVRVLVDRDRESDPYRSTLINSRAKAALAAAGVDVRSDIDSRLLHSKFLVIDKKLAIVGSHNWSEGSYFGFDDLTLALSSAALATELGARFETLWSAGS